MSIPVMPASGRAPSVAATATLAPEGASVTATQPLPHASTPVTSTMKTFCIPNARVATPGSRGCAPPITRAATGAATGPARYRGAVFMRDAFGGTVSRGQEPACLIGEVVGGCSAGSLARASARIGADAAMTGLAPEVPGDEDRPERRVSGATT